MNVLAVVAVIVAVGLSGLSGGRAWAEPRPEVDADTLPQAVEARRLLKAKAYDQALPLLQALVAEGRESADIHSNLGFALRKLGDLDRSWRHYQIAIGIDADHLGAREYLGELLLMRGDVMGAREQLAILERLCPQGCEERDELDDAIKVFLAGQANARGS